MPSLSVLEIPVRVRSHWWLWPVVRRLAFLRCYPGERALRWLVKRGTTITVGGR